MTTIARSSPLARFAAALALALAGCDSAPKTSPSSSDPQTTTTPTAGTPSADATMTTTNDIYAQTATALNGTPVDLSAYRGKVTLVVNVASECGYTPQYAGLQSLHAELADRGFAVLGFPSNEFGGQEPGSAEQIQEFCSSRFGVQFPMFAKIRTKKGDGQSPVYAALAAATGSEPGWNFCKYLVGKDGRPIAFFPSNVAPDSKKLRDAIAAAME